MYNLGKITIKIVKMYAKNFDGCQFSMYMLIFYNENSMSLALDKTIGVDVLVSSHLFNNL